LPFSGAKISGVVIGGATGQPPQVALVKGAAHLKLSKIVFCKKIKINSDLATIYFISATDVRLLKCFRNVLASLAYFCECIKIVIRQKTENTEQKQRHEPAESRRDSTRDKGKLLDV